MSRLSAGRAVHRIEEVQGWWLERACVTVNGGIARATCNGELLTDDMAVPETGPIGLEGDRGQMEYRRIRLKRISGNGAAKQSASLSEQAREAIRSEVKAVIDEYRRETQTQSGIRGRIK